MPWFQSLSRDSVYSNPCSCRRWPCSSAGFNPSVGIAFIQTAMSDYLIERAIERFQSLSRDSVYSNPAERAVRAALRRFNPSVGIAFIQTCPPYLDLVMPRLYQFQSLSRDSVYSNPSSNTGTPEKHVSIPQSG